MFPRLCQPKASSPGPRKNGISADLNAKGNSSHQTRLSRSITDSPDRFASLEQLVDLFRLDRRKVREHVVSDLKPVLMFLQYHECSIELIRTCSLTGTRDSKVRKGNPESLSHVLREFFTEVRNPAAPVSIGTVFG